MGRAARCFVIARDRRLKPAASASLVLLAGLALSASIAGAANELPSGVMYQINGENVPRDKFIKELDDYMGDSYRDIFISHVLIDQKAKALAVQVADDEVDSHAQASVDQVLRERFSGDAAKMDGALKERGMTVEGWKKRLKLDARYDLLIEKILAKDRKVSDEALNRLFEDKYGPGGVQIKVRHILKNVPVAASAEYTLQQYDAEKPKIEADAKARAEEALGKIKAGAAFESVMAEYSDDPRKAQGGMLTAWKGRFGPELDDAAAKLAKGEASRVIKGTDGYRIVQCADIVETEEVHAVHILVATGARGKNRSDEDAKKKAEDLLSQLKAGADFGALAKDNSDDPGSAARGGDLGFFGRRAMVKPFEDTAFALEAGQLSDVVKTNFGYHIIKVLEKRKSQDRTLRQILVSTQFVVVKDRKLRPGLEAKARSALADALKDIKKPGGSFAETAKSISEDLATKADGGLLKTYREGLYGGEFDGAVKSMKRGDEPRIVKDAAGNLHLLQIEDIVKTDLASVRSELSAEEVNRPATPQEKSEYIARLRQEAKIVP